MQKSSQLKSSPDSQTPAPPSREILAHRLLVSLKIAPSFSNWRCWVGAIYASKSTRASNAEKRVRFGGSIGCANLDLWKDFGCRSLDKSDDGHELLVVTTARAESAGTYVTSSSRYAGF